ncbi:MAG: hypothetical protein ABIP51_11125 [Bacteroidia bacterium]
MQKINKHIAFFLLLIFTWVLMPASIAHEVFADHQDTDCHFDHNSTATNVEAIHTHCDIFETNSPIYDIPKLTVFTQPIPVLIIEVKAKFQNSYFHLAQLILPTRAPPVA